MIDPKTILASQAFRLDKVIYNHNGFSIGIGAYIGSDTTVIAMRWNGDDDSVGFPYAGKNPLWFHITPELTFCILTGLLHSNSMSSGDYLNLLNYLEGFKNIKPA